MTLVNLVLGLALLEFAVFLMAVARARGTYKVAAPATSGHEVFERYFRVQMNTIEQLIIFVPAIVVFAHYVNPLIAAGLGLIFVIGRWLYFVSYVKDPKKREVGFVLSFVPNLILLIGAIVGAGFALARYGFA